MAPSNSTTKAAPKRDPAIMPRASTSLTWWAPNSVRATAAIGEPDSTQYAISHPRPNVLSTPTTCRLRSSGMTPPAPFLSSSRLRMNRNRAPTNSNILARNLKTSHARGGTLRLRGCGVPRTNPSPPSLLEVERHAARVGTGGADLLEDLLLAERRDRGLHIGGQMQAICLFMDHLGFLRTSFHGNTLLNRRVSFTSDRPHGAREILGRGMPWSDE